MSDPSAVSEPRRMPAWIPLAIGSGVLWLATIWAAYDISRGDTSRSVFGVFLGASVVLSVITATVGTGCVLIRNQATLSTKLDDVTAEQRRLCIALGENTGAFQQLSARIDDIANPDRVEWTSYAQAAADILGLDRAKVLDFPNGGRSRG